MYRLYLLIALLLTTSHFTLAQQGHELDTDHRFDFLKQHPNSGAYRIDHNLNVFGDSTIRIHFINVANFPDARFGSQADFGNAQFDSLANFEFTQFDSRAIFGFAQFYSLANFRFAQFDSQADFGFTHFDSRADFLGVQFKGEVDFDFITLPDTLRFSEIKTTSEIDLTTTQLDSAKIAQGRFCLIDLRDAPIDKFDLFYDDFRVFHPTYINRPTYEKLTQVYERLLKNFKDRGYLTSHATLDQEYQAFKDLQNPDASPIKKLLNQANFCWNNYGYNKEWIWGWTLVFLAISTLINWLAFPYLVKDVYPVPMIDKALFDTKPENRAQFKGSAFLKDKVRLNFKYLIYAFYYTILIFFGLKLSTERINFKRHAGVALIFTEYVIGLICLGYLANFIISSGVIGQ